MVSFGHSSGGVIIAIAVARSLPQLGVGTQLALIIILAVLSHYLLDYIPHGHYKFEFPRASRNSWALLLIDGVGGALLVLSAITWRYGTGQMLLLAATGLAAANLPDVFTAAVKMGFIPQWLWVKAHQKLHLGTIHWHSPHPSHPLPWGARDIWQVGLACVCLVLIAS